MVKTWHALSYQGPLIAKEFGRVVAAVARHPTGLASAGIIALFALAATFAPQLAPFDPNTTNLAARLRPPSAEHLFGTDSLGRDIFSRTVYGTRVSSLVGLVTVGIALFIGVTLGMIAGFYRGWLDRSLSRFAELILAFPYLIFAIGMMAFLGPGFWNLVVALSLIFWIEFFRLARGETFAQATREYVEAARALGHSSARILISEILPNIFPSILVLATLRIGFIIVLEASLSFLGIGIPPAIPAWGSMIAEGRGVLFIAWWVSTIPGLVLLTLVLAINLLGETLREVLDPRLKVQG